MWSRTPRMRTCLSTKRKAKTPGGLCWRRCAATVRTSGVVRAILGPEPIKDDVLAEHWDVIQNEATKDESRSGMPMFGDKFAERFSVAKQGGN